MIQEQYEKLMAMENQYVSIGITENGSPRISISVPWDMTANAFNMRTPHLYLEPNDLEDPMILKQLRSNKLIGFYSFVPLEDYSFLSQFPTLEDITIHHGENMSDLSFLSNCPNWFQLHIEDAKIETLSPMFEAERKGLHSICVCFVNCRIHDISSLQQIEKRLCELIILQPEGTNEKDRWKTVPSIKYFYREYKTT